MDSTGDSPARTLLGDSERDRFVAVLREHYAAGRLSLEELRRRAEIVLAAAYLDEAEGAMAGLPGMAVQAPAAAGSPGADGQAADGGPDTEQLRLLLRRYRALFNELCRP